MITSVGCCELGSEFSHPTEDGEFVNWLSKYEDSKPDPDPRGEFHFMRS
jgi:hypothetical protein